MTIQSARLIPAIDYSGLPPAYVGKLSAICRTAAECEDLVAWFGDATFCPFLPVLVMVPGTQPTLIPGYGHAPAAELRDCAVVAWHSQMEKLRLRSTVLDYDALREKRGLMRREEVDAAIRNALADRIARHKSSPVTDPFRQPHYPNPTGKTVFPQQPDNSSWKAI